MNNDNIPVGFLDKIRHDTLVGTLRSVRAHLATREKQGDRTSLEELEKRLEESIEEIRERIEERGK
jgi:hypothetical protein